MENIEDDKAEEMNNEPVPVHLLEARASGDADPMPYPVLWLITEPSVYTRTVPVPGGRRGSSSFKFEYRPLWGG